MNMKKTMAAIAAGAVAVSAMATTVSALETKTLHYNLVHYVKMNKKGDADYTVTFPSVPLEVGDKVAITVTGFGGDDEVTIRPQYNDSTYFAPSFTYTNNAKSSKFNSEIPTPGVTNTFPVVETNTNLKNVFVGGTSASTVSFAMADGAAEVGVQSQDTLDNAGNVTLYYVDDAAWKAAIAALPTTLVDADGTQLKTATATKISAGTSGWYADTAANIVAAKATAIAAASNTDADGIGSAFDTAIKTETKKLSDYGVGLKAGTPAAGDTITIKAGKAALATVYVDVLDKDYVASGAGEFADVNADLKNHAIGVQMVVYAADGTTVKQTFGYGAAVLNSFGGGKGVYGFPYKSSIDNTVYNQKTDGNYVNGVLATSVGEGGDVLSHIYTVETDKTSEQINPYSIRAVINDAIQQHNGNVTFVFNTAVKKVAVHNHTHDQTGADWMVGQPLPDGHWGNPEGSYVDNDWDACGVADYTSFGNHYYNSLQYGYDANFDYYQNNWHPDNLFNGLLLVNSNLTLSLSDTEKFDWTEKSLSFTWEAIEDSALTANQYANYVQNMVLRTSTTWYWDSLDVVLADVETPGIGVGAPTDAPEEDIDEEEEDEPMEIDEPEEPEEPADEPEEPAEVAPAVVNNPTTGNASVALAVIPVALAAAAIVAKKRG